MTQPPNIPPYGTPEYVQWYYKNVAPPPTAYQQPPKNKHHPVRWTLAGVAALLIVVGIVAGAAGSNGHGKHLTAATKHSALPASVIPTTPDQTTDVQSEAPASDIPDSELPDTDAPTTPAGPTFNPVGSTMNYTESSDFTDPAEAHIKVAAVGTYAAAIKQDEFGSNEAPHEGTYRVFKVTMHVIKGSIDDVSSNSFRWETAGGRVFDESEGNSYESGWDSDSELNTDGAAAGQTVEGEIIFDVPAGAGKLEITDYDNTVIGGWTASR
jgi:hypothetical protein